MNLNRQTNKYSKVIYIYSYWELFEQTLGAVFVIVFGRIVERREAVFVFEVKARFFQD